MNKSYRIKTEVGTNTNKNIKLKLDNNIADFDILSLNISQRNSYQAFNGDFGVVVGRVIANGGVGIPNAKVSIFIPLDEEDESNDEIRSIYPYKTPRDQNIDGKRYNLLPRIGRRQPDGRFKPKQAFGSFPTKEEIMVNDDIRYVYEKYYKYTTITNSSGDYMLYGVPVGVQTVHMSVDITDIGRFSMTPQTMIKSLGFSPNLFINNGNLIKPSNDLDDLPNIDTQEISVDVIPFYGDEENFDIGITRQDFRIRAELATSVTIFGSAMTMPSDVSWGNADLFGTNNITDRLGGLSPDGITRNVINKYRGGNINTRILSVPNTVDDTDINDLSYDVESMVLLEDTQYFEYQESGSFVYIIPCDRKKVVTNEIGELIEVPADNPDGIFTEFVGCFLTEFEELSVDPIQNLYNGDNSYKFSGLGLFAGQIAPTVYRHKLKIPQSVDTFNSDNENSNERWIKKVKRFEGNKLYSVAQFHTLSFSNDGNNNHNDTRGDVNYNIGNILVRLNINGDIIDDFPYFYRRGNGLRGLFGAQWLNMTLTYKQPIYIIRDSGQTTESGYPLFIIEQRTSNFILDNDNPIGGGLRNNSLYLRGDVNPTDFIEVDVSDLIEMNGINSKSFSSNDFENENDVIESNIPSSGGRLPTLTNAMVLFGVDDHRYKTDRMPATYINNTSEEYNGQAYFYKGVGGSDCVRLIFDLDLV